MVQNMTRKIILDIFLQNLSRKKKQVTVKTVFLGSPEVKKIILDIFYKNYIGQLTTVFPMQTITENFPR